MSQLSDEIEAETHFDRIENYDEEIPEHIQQYYLEKKSAKILRTLHTHFGKRHIRGVDLGCGTGEHIHYMMNLHPHIRIDGVDNSKRQLALALSKHRDNEGRKRVDQAEYFHTSMEKLPFDDATYDFAYAINSLHHLPNPEEQLKVFAEIYRVLKKNGIFLIVEMNVINPIIHFYLSYIFPKLRNIDEGEERWIREELIQRSKFMLTDTNYFTFTPDFLPKVFLRLFQKLDLYLDKSRLAPFGAHIMFTSVKEE
jgi:ubiquinone/menaquinone biosynthesis C-methylase UbiE